MSPDFNYCTFLPRCTSFFFFKPKHDLLTSHSVRDMCGSNLNQSRGYKIALESLLHRVQSYGQSEFPSYRSHCPLYFRLDPTNNKPTDVQKLPQ